MKGVGGRKPSLRFEGSPRTGMRTYFLPGDDNDSAKFGKIQLCEALAVAEAIRRMGQCPSLSSSPHPQEYFGSNKAQEKFKGGNTFSNTWKVTSMQERHHDPEKKQYVSGWRS